MVALNLLLSKLLMIVSQIFLLTAMKTENWERVKELLLQEDSDIDVNSKDEVNIQYC